MMFPTLAAPYRIPPHYKRILADFSPNLINWYPGWDLTGTTAEDIIGHLFQGTYSAGVTLNNSTGPDGYPVPRFTTGRVDFYSAAASAAFNGAEGTHEGYAKVSGVGVWTDAALRYIGTIQADSVNRSILRKQTADNSIIFGYSAGGVTFTVTYFINTTGWFHWCSSWSKSANTIVFYINGTPVFRGTGLGTFSGAPASGLMNIGSNSTSSTWDGWLAHTRVHTRVMTDAEVKRLASADVAPVKMTIIGDSISASNSLTWYNYLLNLGYNRGYVGFNSKAVSGNSIISNMATQAASCALDDADVVIFFLGTNDNNAGNMATLQATVEAGIATVRASNPRARLYYMNILDRWTDGTGAFVSDLANIRTAIQAACTAQNITCWDTHGWFTGVPPDGLHPSVSQRQEIAAQVYARRP